MPKLNVFRSASPFLLFVLAYATGMFCLAVGCGEVDSASVETVPNVRIEGSIQQANVDPEKVSPEIDI